MIKIYQPNNISQKYKFNEIEQSEKKLHLPIHKAMLSAVLLSLAASAEAGINLQNHLPLQDEYSPKVYEFSRKGKPIYMIKKSKNHWVETDKYGKPLYPDDSIPQWCYFVGAFGIYMLAKGLKMAYDEAAKSSGNYCNDENL